MPSNPEIQGRLGEEIVADFLQSKGHDVKISFDKYDMHKDMLLDGETLEVKTQVPHYKEKALTFREFQLVKCFSAKYVAFVVVPNPEFGVVPEVDGKVFITRGKDLVVSRKKIQGRDMLLVPWDMEGLHPIYTMSPEQIAVLQKYSSSRGLN